jgi:hypothetical protein
VQSLHAPHLAGKREGTVRDLDDTRFRGIETVTDIKVMFQVDFDDVKGIHD